MANVLIAFATTQGQTRKIADHVGARLRSLGHAPSLWDTAKPEPAPLAPNGVMLMGSLHAGKYQQALAEQARKHASSWAAMPVAFVSVSLSAASLNAKEGEELRKISDRFLADAGINAALIHHAAGAVRDSELNWLIRWILHQIARQHGAALDPSGDTEFTDWVALDDFVDRYAKTLPRP